MEVLGSRDIAVAAIQVALTKTRQEERKLVENLSDINVSAVAVDFGGEFTNAITKVIERAVVAAKREGVIGESHAEEGAVAGAAHEAVTQIINKAIGLNVGGKIGIARQGAHLSVCVFFAIGLLNLNDVAIGLGHRAI